MIRPTKQDYLLGLAKVASRLSHDTQTQHGCILANDQHQVLAMGCNGFPRGGLNDASLPSVRPDKYPWMIHSEQNALANAQGNVEGSTAYITGKSCFSCMIHLWQNGVRKLIEADTFGWQKDNEEAPLRQKFLENYKIQIEQVKPDYLWIIDLAADLVASDNRLKQYLMDKLNNHEYQIGLARST